MRIDPGAHARARRRRRAGGGPPAALQGRLDDLGTPLHDITFVVVDLETTGGSPRDCRITEIGAVKARHGERLGEFATLVDPQQPIPREITALTGITDEMARRHPPIEAVAPAFIEFIRGCVLVAHNARFDTGFLNATLRRLDYPPLDHPVVCTAALARRLLHDEVRNCRLATLARHLRARTTPNHRALMDARATVDVLHALLERAGSFGVVTLEDLVEFSAARNAPLFRSRAPLANHLPRSPGVYAFRSASGEILYVGKASDLRARVRQYFGGDDRRFVADMVKETATVDHWVTPTPIEAEVRELRLIHEHAPRFNRRSKHPQKPAWVRLTEERFPRLSIVSTPRAGDGAVLGPLPSRRHAMQVVEALQEAAPIRRCTDRIGPATRFSACVLGEIGRCVAPCEGRVDPEEYRTAIAPVARAVAGDPAEVVLHLSTRMRRLATQGRFEEAAQIRDRLRTVLSAAQRARRLAAMATAGPLVAHRTIIRGHHAGRVEVVAVRSGALVASARVVPAEVDGIVADFHARVRFGTPVPPASPAEADLVGRWLERGAKVIACDGRFAEPVPGGAVIREALEMIAAATRSTNRPASELSAKRTRRPQRKAS